MQLEISFPPNHLLIVSQTANSLSILIYFFNPSHARVLTALFPCYIQAKGPSSDGGVAI